MRTMHGGRPFDFRRKASDAYGNTVYSNVVQINPQ